MLVRGAVIVCFLTSSAAFAANPFEKLAGTYTVRETGNCIVENSPVACDAKFIEVAVNHHETCFTTRGSSKDDQYCVSPIATSEEWADYVSYGNTGAAWSYQSKATAPDFIRRTKHVGLSFSHETKSLVFNISDMTVKGFGSKPFVHLKRSYILSK